MATADRDTLILAAEIGKRRPKSPVDQIALIADRLVKICATLHKRVYSGQNLEGNPLIDDACELAHDIGATFEAVDNPKFISGTKSFYLTFSLGDHVPIGSLRVEL